MTLLHVPILVEAIVEGLHINPRGNYVDATYGRGGHSAEILKQLSDAGHLWVMDRDAAACAHARQHFVDKRVVICQGSFADLDVFLNGSGIDGILFDLGVSSPQLDEAERGFSFRQAALLDMRFDVESKEPVHKWLNTASYQEIADVLHFYGQEPLARSIARAIVQRRLDAPITLTTDLAQLVASIVHKRFGESKVHPATRTFQALRIFINDELGHLEKALIKAAEALHVGGRLVCLSFHGLETKMLKSLARGVALLQGGEPSTARFKTLRKHKADAWEQRNNPRSRSAQLTVLEKIL